MQPLATRGPKGRKKGRGHLPYCRSRHLCVWDIRAAYTRPERQSPPLFSGSCGSQVFERYIVFVAGINRTSVEDLHCFGAGLWGPCSKCVHNSGLRFRGVTALYRVREVIEYGTNVIAAPSGRMNIE